MSMKSAYASSGKVFEQVSKLRQPGLYEQLKSIKPGEILVIGGDHDHVETILPTLKVPFEVVNAADLAKYQGARVAFVNCREYDGAGPKTWVEQFVGEGGRLVTTDWALSFVNKVFPKSLWKTGTAPNDVVEIQCDSDISARLVGLNYAQCHPKWWLEVSSYVFDIGPGVTPLITSEELKAKYGQPYIAAAFRHGKGEVVHFISHFIKQQTHFNSAADHAGLEAFLENMGADKSIGMEDDAKVAELEAAYSTLNTLAYLLCRAPIVDTGMKSVMMGQACPTSQLSGVGGSGGSGKSGLSGGSNKSGTSGGSKGLLYQANGMSQFGLYGAAYPSGPCGGSKKSGGWQG